ncbi:hypothetical protein BDZ94DRAFT_1267207 [Collybia nuda]|uniref:Uncharacterized protein n=1 Tax=Collybia nuda TaxID=64659 RepID=A0A9P5XYE3_9AGAR|nr:hypothetical protein BDZ94DRAFT_1267207 [Collybia nuda]
MHSASFLPPLSSSVTSSNPTSPSSNLLPLTLSPKNYSSSSPTSLSPALIALALDYICPPSQLSLLPPHFISSSLLQRHHFLHILPNDPASYLTWPSDSGSHTSAIRLLEAFQKPIDDVLYSTLPIRYSADEESTYAHVAISPDHTPGLRLVFQWNSPEGWKYHNVALMPFPSKNFDTAPGALFLPPHMATTLNVISDEDGDDDSYWNGYDVGDPENSSSCIGMKSDDLLGNTEDAYWAQYAEVHGSGDSTLPSPLPLRQKHDSPERVIISYTGSNPSSVYNPLEPPSPNTLSQRLEDLSPRSPSPSPVDDKSDFIPASSHHNTTSAAPSTQVTSVTANSSSLYGYAVDAPVTSQGARMTTPSTDSCDALKDAIRGLYRLWKNGRPSCPRLVDEDKEFLNIVRQVMAERSQP